MRTPRQHLEHETPRMRRSTGAWLIRREIPTGFPKPPARPPSPGGINTPGGTTGGGMVCPGTEPAKGPAAGAADVAAGDIAGRLAAGVEAGRAILLAGAPHREAADQTALETPANSVFRKPSALGGKSIHMTIVEGDMKGKSFDVTGIGTYTIGRKECDIVLEDEKVSRKHASIVIIRDNQYAVQDLASRNGTFVNGVRLTRRNLQHNDLIRVGNTTLRFTVFDGPVPVEA